MQKDWWKSKTIRLALAAILGAWAAYFGDALALKEAIASSIAALATIFLRQGQGVPIRPAVILLAVIALAACAGGPPVVQPSGGATGGRGGDSESDQVRMDPSVAFANPGGTAVSMPLSVDDTTSSNQAGDSPQLVIAPASTLASRLMETGPVEENILELMRRLMAEREQEGTDEAEIDFRLADLRKELVAIKERKLEAVADVAPDLSSLKAIVFVVIQVKSSGEEVQKLDAAAIEKAAANLGLVSAIANKALD